MSKRDGELHSKKDYDSDEVEAAYQCLLEVANILEENQIDSLLVGGWVPELLFPSQGHIGSIDVDFVIKDKMDQITAQSETLAGLMEKQGYRKTPDKFFSYQKTFQISGRPVAIDVDFLTNKYNGSSEKHRSNRVRGTKVLKASAADYAFSFEPLVVSTPEKKNIRIVTPLVYLIMKSLAFADPSRAKPKDAYDIYFVLSHEKDLSVLKEQYRLLLSKEVALHKPSPSYVEQMSKILSDAFASATAKGPQTVLRFQEIDPDTPEGRASAVQISYLVRSFLGLV